MKILEITRSYYPSVGGLEKFVLQRIDIYKRLNIEYHILTSTYSSEKLDYNFIPDNVTKFNQLTKYNFAPGLNKDFFISYDIISINQMGNYLSDRSIYLASKLGKKIILTPHLYFHTKNYNLLKKFHKKFVVPSLLEKVNKVICFTNYEKEYWNRKFNVPNQKLTIIPHYFRSELSEDSNIKSAKKFLLFLGRSYNNKRIDLLLKAFLQSNQLDFDLKLTIKQEDVNPKLKKIIEADNRIKLLGYVSESQKRKLLSSCTAIVLPTDYEAFGIVCLEASSFKRPIICSHLPVLSEILDNKGVLYFENNVESIKKSLEVFNSLSAAQLRKMGDVNYDNLKKYDFDNVVESYNLILR